MLGLRVKNALDKALPLGKEWSANEPELVDGFAPGWPLAITVKVAECAPVLHGDGDICHLGLLLVHVVTLTADGTQHIQASVEYTCT